MNSPSQHFCLRWNNYQANLTCVFDQLLQSESFVDVTLAVAGFSIKAHKVILSACSPFFKAMLCDNPCEHPIVVMRDVGSADMLAIVQFMYKGEISVSQEQLPGLLKVAEMLKIRGLADVPDDADMPPAQLRPAAGAGSPAQRHMPSPLRRSASCDTSPPPRAQGTPESLETSVDLPLMTSSSRSTPSPLLAVSSAMTASRPPASITMTTSGMSISAGPAVVSQPPRMLSLPRQLNDEVEIRPAIAEMIKEEERAKMLENVTSWNRSPETTFQHQLQQAWQKSWNQQQSLLQNLRFRERGPLKSWRPETMADAILCVLREGHSLSQAARKYDIPYPTFVLYANRVHNLLGPSLDGPGDLRPKGRGRPQRILLGHWTDETIKNVIRAVVFRDTSGIKEQMENKAATVAAMANAAALKQVSNSSGVLPPGILTQTNGRSAGPPYPMAAGGGPSTPRTLPHPSMMHGAAARAPIMPSMMHGSSARAPGVPGMPLARAQRPNLLGFPDLPMMMGFFPPGMLAPPGTVPRIRLPLRMPGADAGMGGFSPLVRGAGRPVPPLSAVNGPQAAPAMLPPVSTSTSHSFMTRPQEGSSGVLTAPVPKQRVDDLNAADVTCLLEPIQEMTEGSPQSMTTAVAATDDDQSLTQPAVDMTESSVDDLLNQQFDKSPPCDASSAIPHLGEVDACRNVFGVEDGIGDSMFPSFSGPSDEMDMEDHVSRVARFTLSPPQPVMPDIGHVASAATPAIAALQASP